MWSNRCNNYAANKVYKKRGRKYFEYFLRSNYIATMPVDEYVLKQIYYRRRFGELEDEKFFYTDGWEFTKKSRFSYDVRCTIDDSCYSVRTLGKILRLYVTPEVEKLLNQAVGNVRLLYNNFVAAMNEAFDNGKPFKVWSYKDFQYRDVLTEVSGITYHVMLANGELVTKRNGKYYHVNRIWHEAFWDLVPAQAYDQEKNHFNTALQRMYDKVSRKPTFHSKCDKNSFTINANYSRNYCDVKIQNPDGGKKTKEERMGIITLPIFKAIKFTTRSGKFLQQDLLPENRAIQGITITREPSGKWYCAINLLQVREKRKIQGINSDSVIGIDLGVKNPLTITDGKKAWVENLPKPYVTNELKVKRLQRKLSSLKNGTDEYWNVRKKLARVHEKIRNIRHNALNQITAKLVKIYVCIFTENLSVVKMLKDKRYKWLHKHITDLGWYEFTRQLTYKSDLKGILYGKVDRDFPSSQLCYRCKKKNTIMKSLGMRTFRCCNCGFTADRDVNAAFNVRSEGIRVFITPLIKAG